MRALEKEIYQLVTFNIDPSFLKSLPDCIITNWIEGCYDVVPTTTNKWAGILQMVKHFGINPQEVATIGDGMNDIEMLQGSNFSIAMGNASDEVKKHAKFVTTHVKKNGIYNGIKHLLG